MAATEKRKTTALRARGPRVKPEDGAFASRMLAYPSFAGLVVLAWSLNPFPSRTRPLNSTAPMVLSLKTWKSRSLPGLPRTEQNLFNDEWCIHTVHERPPAMAAVLFVELPSANAKPPRFAPRRFFVWRYLRHCLATQIEQIRIFWVTY